MKFKATPSLAPYVAVFSVVPKVAVQYYSFGPYAAVLTRHRNGSEVRCSMLFSYIEVEKGKKVKLSMWQAMEARKVVRRRGSHIF
jgi:hypothetical protein